MLTFGLAQERATGLAALTAGASAPVPLPISPWRQRGAFATKAPDVEIARAAATAAAGDVAGRRACRPRPCQRQPGRPPIFARTLHIGHGAAVIVPVSGCSRAFAESTAAPGVVLRRVPNACLVSGGINGGDAYLDGAIRPGAPQRAVRVSPSLMATTRQNMTVRHEQRRAGTNRGAMEPKGRHYTVIPLGGAWWATVLYARSSQSGQKNRLPFHYLSSLVGEHRFEPVFQAPRVPGPCPCPSGAG